ncbi:MAG: aminoacyl-tRNA hydrolase [Gammaproteobacteria bacterium]|nr:aminoacyl-tRNA hydrolase [Gammaproteobacteria bacterium]MDH5239313.1 aminoacyl-tRNA hydrolase [Gammaproteobacteria bacterium]MDH5262963.1 aminoacyl-tRNA hydrolase [Gammaproteobacteria bacterium]MDH5583366.1 aminoacyl-tRNA hydrolase [Gammaproteobacteria bacterium]
MSNSIRIIAGLGNPGEKYERTLHNAGFWFVDALAKEYGGSFRYDKKFDADCCKIDLQGEEIWLVKPQSFMNLSGGPIRSVIDYYRLGVGNLLVAHDEIDLPPGTTRLKMGGGHGGHNGLRDIIQHCGPDFVRLRLGVGHPGDKNLVTDYVLKRGSADVERAIEENISEAVKIMPMLIDEGLNAATKALHTKE